MSHLLSGAVPRHRRPSLLRVEPLEAREAAASVVFGWEWLGDEPATTGAASHMTQAPPPSEPTRESAAVNNAQVSAPAALSKPDPSGQAATPREVVGTDKVEIRVGRGGGPRLLSGGPSNQPPVITSFVHVINSSMVCTFTGQVSDETPGGLTIRFGGHPAAVKGLTAVTDSTGAFQVSVTVATDGSDTGNTSVQTTDPQGLDSNFAYRYLAP